MSAVEILVYLSSNNEKVRRCVDSVLQHTPKACNVRFWGDCISNISVRYVNKFCVKMGPIEKRNVTFINSNKAIGYNSLMTQALREVKSRYIALLNDDVVVTDGWISKMLVCLRSESSLGVVCPFTNIGARQNLFSTLPPNTSIDEIAAKLNKVSRREYPRITSADICILFKKEVLDKIQVFQISVCLEPDLCHAARKSGFNVAIADDVFVYCDKVITAPLTKEDLVFYKNNPLGRFRQSISKENKVYNNVSTVTLKPGKTIKIYSPSDIDPINGKWWGDHWVRENLYETFEKQGWSRSEKNNVDFSLLLKGGVYVESEATKCAVWIYSHPNDDIDKFLSPEFDVVYTLSEKHANQIRNKRPDIKVLLPATSKTYESRKGDPKYDILIVGNSAKPERVKIVKYLIKKGYNIGIVGSAWEKIINQKYLIAPYWDNEKYSDLFNQAKLTVYIHHEDMRELDFVAVRVLDAIACSDCFIICDKNEGLSKLGLEDVPQFSNPSELEEIIGHCLANSKECSEKMKRWRRIIKRYHTFKRRVEQIESISDNKIQIPFILSNAKRSVAVYLSTVHKLCYDMNIKFSRGMVESFRELGFDSYLVHDIKTLEDQYFDVVFCAAPSFQEDFEHNMDTKYIMYQSEQCPREDIFEERADKFWKVVSKELPKYDIIFEPFEDQIKLFNGLGYKNVTHFRVGYHPIFEINIPANDRYDVTFIGHPLGSRMRRLLLLDCLEKFFKSRRLNYYIPSAIKWRAITGSEYEQLLFDGKVSLNIHYTAIRYFEYHKLIVDYFSNKRFIISEPISNLLPFVAGEHIAICNANEFEEQIEYYLNNPEKRSLIVNNAYSFVKTCFTLTGNLKHALEESNIL